MGRGRDRGAQGARGPGVPGDHEPGVRRGGQRPVGRANLARDRAYNGIHNHPDCTWSGAYYVSLGERIGDDPLNGIIEFLDPRMGVNWVQLPGQPFGSQLQINPEAGTMVVFPSWMHHWVHPFHGTGERISIAFNVRMNFR